MGLTCSLLYVCVTYLFLVIREYCTVVHVKVFEHVTEYCS